MYSNAGDQAVWVVPECYPKQHLQVFQHKYHLDTACMCTKTAQDSVDSIATLLTGLHSGATVEWFWSLLQLLSLPTCLDVIRF